MHRQQRVAPPLGLGMKPKASGTDHKIDVSDGARGLFYNSGNIPSLTSGTNNAGNNIQLGDVPGVRFAAQPLVAGSVINRKLKWRADGRYTRQQNFRDDAGSRTLSAPLAHDAPAGNPYSLLNSRAVGGGAGGGYGRRALVEGTNTGNNIQLGDVPGVK